MNRNKPFARRRIIHTDEDCYDLMYWSINFGVSMQQLIEAITEVGPLVMDVERQLGASTGLMDPLAANRHHHVSIVQPDPSLFLVRNDRSGGGMETGANDPWFSPSKSNPS